MTDYPVETEVFDNEPEQLDEFYELAKMFAALGAQTSVPAWRRWVHTRISDICDRMWLHQRRRSEAARMSLTETEDWQPARKLQVLPVG